MVAVCNKELLSWYLITIKLKQRLEAGLPNTSPRSDTSEPPQQQQWWQLQQPSSPLQVVVDGGIRNPGMGSPRPPEDDWVISINKKLKDARQYDAAGSWRKTNIYRVPHCLGDSQSYKAYIPQIVSLGPYHHGRMLLQPMELHKWRALNNVLKRQKQSIKLYLDSMKELEDRARACYEGPLKLMSSNEFAEMMVLDGCFILEFLQATTSGFEELGYDWNDPVFSMRETTNFIVRDMIMLENQIPLFVLDKLYGLQLKKPDLKGQVAQLAYAFFARPRFDPLSDNFHCLDVFRKSLLYKRPNPVPRKRSLKLKSSTRDSTTADPPPAKVGLHYLDVFRKCLLYKGPDNVPEKRDRRQIHCVTDLKDAGIKFRKHKTGRLSDIQFNDGVLDIPRIMIDDDTESSLFNLIAFEQCHSGCKKDIANYVAFLDNLIDSAEDVSYLRRHKIIEHWLGDDGEVANLISRLCQEVAFDILDGKFSELSEKIMKHYERNWNIWRATLKQKYFSNPWATLSLVAAVTLLLLTAAQTFYTVYPYYLPRKSPSQ